MANLRSKECSDKKFYKNWKSQAPPSYVALIRSNLNFEVIWRSKKVKNAKCSKSADFWYFLTKSFETLPIFENLRAYVIPCCRSLNLVCSCLIIQGQDRLCSMSCKQHWQDLQKNHFLFKLLLGVRDSTKKKIISGSMCPTQGVSWNMRDHFWSRIGCNRRQIKPHTKLWVIWDMKGK